MVASIEALLEDARRLSLGGDHLRAVQSQIAAINRLQAEGRACVVELKTLGLLFHRLGDPAAAATTFARLLDQAGDDAQVCGNLGVALLELGRVNEALPHLLRAAGLEPDAPNWLDGLTHGYTRLGRVDDARATGLQSLQLKDAAAGPSPEPLARQVAPPFDVASPERNLIVYSLWGDAPRYLEGALRNAMLAPDLFPGWTCRFHCDDSVPIGLQHQLLAHGAQVVRMARPAQFYDGLFWRFSVIGEAGVDRFLVRDADSVLSAREKAAVDDWLLSGALFHVMRDNPLHSELMLAGMWGGVGGALPPLSRLARFSVAHTPTRHIDQWFLRAVIWPRIRAHCLVHDSFYPFPGARPFPVHAWAEPDFHVGMNYSASTRARREPARYRPGATVSDVDGV
jgi:tetratricopeptide (TPR) repeat protein